MKSFGRMILGLAAVAIVLFAFALLFSPQVRTAFGNQAGESPVGQLKANAEYPNPGQQQQQTPKVETVNKASR